MTLAEALDVMKAKGFDPFRYGQGWSHTVTWADDETLIEHARRLQGEDQKNSGVR